jgi:uncharacterized protein (TIGR03118 family)
MRAFRLQSATVIAATLVAATALAAQNEGFRVSNLISDVPGLAPRTSGRVINPWGLAEDQDNDVFYVAENGTGLITAHAGANGAILRSITVPAPASSTNLSTPTGLVFNRGSGFVISNTSTNKPKHGRSVLLFVTEDGTIGGWNSSVVSTSAVIVIDNSGAEAVYKGAALAKSTNFGTCLYAANFHAGIIEQYDTNFALVGMFYDPAVPSGFAPFGIHTIQSKLFVTYAKQAEGMHDDEPGPGNGVVDIFNPDGMLVRTFTSGGTLNSPWGVTLAPTHFGIFGGTLLVGNFGDGTINAFNLITGEFLGQFTDQNGSTISIPGLWSVEPNRNLPQIGFDYTASRLYFTAGIDSEANGLIGTVRPISPNLTPMR